VGADVTPGEKAISDGQVVLAEMLLANARELHALAVREAKAKAEAAELVAERERAMLMVCRAEWKRMGLTGNGVV
jgi:hypothetical protein